MLASELRMKLLSEGCNELNFAVLSRGVGDNYCLDREGNKWIVFYTERGNDDEPIYASESEDDACCFFYEFIMKQEHRHIVGFFRNESRARELEEKLCSVGIGAIRNDIPVFDSDPRFRVFVVGKDIFKVRQKLGDLSIYFEEDAFFPYTESKDSLATSWHAAVSRLLGKIFFWK